MALFSVSTKTLLLITDSQLTKFKMNSINNSIIGNEILEIYIGKSQTDDNLPFIDSLYLRIRNNYLIITVNEDTDEIVYKIEKSINNIDSLIQIKNDSDDPLSSLINNKIIWFWTNTNNLGYNDSCQFQDSKNNIIQLIVEASFIRIFELREIEIMIK